MCKPDIIITCAYGQLVPNILLETPKYKAINVHASLLPKLRGGAPIHHAIIDGYKETGITIMYMIDKMDAGNIIKQSKIDILPTDNMGTLHDKLSLLGSKLLMETLPSIFNFTNDSIEQNENEVTIGYNIKREEELINFNKSAVEVINQIRGLYPYPLAYVLVKDEELKVLSAEIYDKEDGIIGQITEINKSGIIVKCNDISIKITKVKPNGKREMDIIDYINGIKKEEYVGMIL